MKGEANYLKMKEKLWELDSNSVQIQGALDIPDSYFEEILFLNLIEKMNYIIGF